MNDSKILREFLDIMFNCLLIICTGAFLALAATIFAIKYDCGNTIVICSPVVIYLLTFLLVKKYFNKRCA